MVLFTIYGVYHESDTYFCQAIVKRLKNEIKDDIEMEFYDFLEIDYILNLDNLKVKYGPFFAKYEKLHVVIIDNKPLGDVKSLIELAKSEEYNLPEAEKANTVMLNRSVREQLDKVYSRSRPLIYLEFVDETKSMKRGEALSLGNIHIELFTDLCPIACENFIKLCLSTEKQKQYVTCPIHRIVKNGWFQTGDIIDGSGKNSLAIINSSGYVQDESFSVDFGFKLGGVVGYANSGPHSNGSQFFVTLGPAEWMNNNFLGIGRVIQGFSVLKEINGVTCSNQVPTKNIIVTSSGYSKDKKY